MGSWSSAPYRSGVVLQVVLALVLVNFAHSQGLQTSPYSSPSMLRGLSGRGGANLAPSNPLALPGSPSSGPRYRFNLQRYVSRHPAPYSQSSVRLPVPIRHNVRSRSWHGGLPAAIQLEQGFSAFRGGSLGIPEFLEDQQRLQQQGGRVFRRRLPHNPANNTLVGVNGFYDTSRLGGTWYSSGSLGLQMAALVGGQ